MTSLYTSAHGLKQQRKSRWIGFVVSSSKSIQLVQSVPIQRSNMNDILKITCIMQFLLLPGLKSFVITQDDSSVTEIINDLFNGTDGIYEVLEMFEGSSEAVQEQLSNNLSGFLTHLFTQSYNDETEFNFMVQQEIIGKLDEFGGFDHIVENLERIGIEFDESWSTIEDEIETTTSEEPITESGKLESSSMTLDFSFLTIICLSGMIF